MSRSLNALYGWLLLLPAIVLLAAFTHYPALATLWHSFYSTPKGARPARFVGLDNYAVMRDDPVFWQSLWNNLWFALGTIPTSIGIALVMALWVNRNLRGRGFLRHQRRQRKCRQSEGQAEAGERRAAEQQGHKMTPVRDYRGGTPSNQPDCGGIWRVRLGQRGVDIS